MVSFSGFMVSLALFALLSAAADTCTANVNGNDSQDGDHSHTIVNTMAAQAYSQSQQMLTGSQHMDA